MNKKAAAAVGVGIAATLAFGYLVTRAKAEQVVPVSVNANPIKTVLLIDGYEVETPIRVNLKPGKHTFTAVPKSPNLVVLYGFDRWTVNGQTISYSTVAAINITGPATITAQYMIAESGRYPIMGIYAPAGQALAQKTYQPRET